MNKYFHGLLTGISVLPALLVMPAMATIEATDGALINTNITEKYHVNGVDVMFDGASAQGLSGAVYGGVIEAEGDGADVTINNFTFSGNSSTSTSGAVDNYGSNLSITGNTSFNNNSSSRGGAVNNWGGGTLGINGPVEFNNNTAQAVILSGLQQPTNTNYYLQKYTGGFGGGLYNYNTATISGATFTDNHAKQVLRLAYADANGDEALPAKNTYGGGYGGAIYNNGDLTVNEVSFVSNDADVDGGAIYNSGDLTVNKVSFIGNDVDGWGGAIATGGTLNIDNAVFDGNTAKYAGAIIDYLDSTGGVSINGTISNTVLKNNSAEEIGAVGLYTKYAVSNFNNVDFISNHATSGDADSDGSGAMFVGAEAGVNIRNSVFDSNTSNAGAGAIGTRGFKLGSNNAAKMNISGSTFKNNVAVTKGGAINNYLYNDANDDGYVSVTDSLFVSNSAANGGAIYNNTGHLGDKLINPRSANAQDVQDIDTPLSRIQVGNIYFGDTSFTNNIASADGGAIYNEGVVTIAANNKDVMFSGNKANVVTDGQGAITSFTANDVYNVGTLNLNAASGKMIALSGGVDGSGVMNVSGAGKVDVANTLKGQNVTVAANTGEFHLNGVDLTGSTVSVASGATLNLMDNNINNYSGITLAGGSNLKTDIDLSNGGKDGFVATGAFNLTQLGIVGDSAAGAVTQFTLSDQVVNVADNLKVFTTNLAYTVEDGESAGKIKVTAGAAASGGLAAAAGSTTEMTRENIVYSVTADDATVAASAVEVKNADMLIAGQGTGALDETVTLTKNLTVGDTSTLSIENAKFAGAGTIENTNGGFLTILNSHIATDINNAGYMYSDPSVYSGTTNNIGVIDYAEADTFDTTAVLNNSGVVNVLNGVTFNSGATVTGNGVINLAGGTTHFNNTASANTVKLANGADFDGTLASTGILDTRNGNIDTITGGVSGGDLYLDANLVAGTRDNFGDGTTGATIKGIKLANAGYGTADSVTLDMGGATLDSDVDIQGVNYYTEVTQSGDNVTFANKLINESNLYNKLGANWTGGNYIKNAANYTNGADATHLTVGEALSALDTQVKANTDAIGDVDFSDESSTTSILKSGETTTVRDALLSLDTAIANNVVMMNNTFAATVADSANTATYDNDTVYNDGTVGAAIKTINTNIGKVHGLIEHDTPSDSSTPLKFRGSVPTASTNVVNEEYKGNLAVGTTIEDHLVALDNTLGTMSTLSGDHVDNTKSVAGNLEQLSVAIDNAEAHAAADATLKMNNAINQANAYTDARLRVARDTAVAQANVYTDRRIETLDKDLSAGVAGAAALSSVEVSNVGRGEMSVGAGYGYFNGQSAAAFGAAMGLSNRWSVNAGAGVSNADVTFRAGTNYKFKLF